MAHDDLQRLVDELLPRGQFLLEKYGEAYPFGATLRTNGEITADAAYDGEESDPDALEDLLIRGFRRIAAAGEIRAVAWAYTVTVRNLPGVGATKALKILAEHEDGEVVVLYMPFRKRLLLGVRYGEFVRVEGEPRVFG